MIPPTEEWTELGSHIWDVVVIGAGPAGSISALQLARNGVKVLLVDAKSFPRHKVCGGCMNQAAVGILRDCGLEDQLNKLSTAELSEFRLSAGGRQVCLPLSGGKAVTRESLDTAILQCAIDLGSSFFPGVHALVGPCENGARLIELTQKGRRQTIHSKIVISACGLGNRALAKLPGFAAEARAGSRVGLETLVKGPTPGYERTAIYMGVAKDGYVGLTKVAGGGLHVAAAVDRTAVGRKGGPGSLVASILQDAGLPIPFSEDEATWRGTAGLTRRAQRVWGERLFVVGDSAGYVEPFTGEGIHWALAGGMGVVSRVLAGLESWDSALGRDWDRWYRGRIRKRQRVCRAITYGLKNRVMVDGAIALLRWAPWLAHPITKRIYKESAYESFDTGVGNGVAAPFDEAS